jgi:biopolymer transport protein ExbB/TolQ
MNIRVTCPHCHGIMESKEEFLGKQARCPYCMQIVRVERSANTQDGPGMSAAPSPSPSPSAAAPAPSLDISRAHSKPDGQPPEAIPTSIQRTEVDNTGATGARGAQRPRISADDGPSGLIVAGAAGHRQRRSQWAVMLKSLIRQGNPTDASVLLTGVIAAAVTFLAYAAIIWPIRGTYVGALLAERGWVAYATFYFTVWASVVLVVKFWKIAHQRTSLTYDLLPVDRSVKITPGNVDLIENHIRKLPLNPRKSFLINRLLMGLDNFRARKSVPEVGAVLNSQADTDAAMVDSSYAMLKVLIWAIPILGFIGTVIGISEAVNGFTQAVKEAENLEKVKAALGLVTNGLAVAFDTTLLGLILSMVIMFPTNSVQKAEEDLLSTIDQYCNENLLPRLATEAETRAAGPDHETLGLVNAYQAALQQWQKRLENLETALMEKLVDHLGEVREEMAKKTQAELKIAE